MSYEDLTNGELIEILKQFPLDYKILSEWTEHFEIDVNDEEKTINIIP